MNLTPYQQELTEYNYHCETAVKNGKIPKIAKGLSDVFRVFSKHGARSNVAILNRLYSNHGIKTFIRGNRRQNFDKVAMWVIANTSLENRTFSTRACQSQIAERLGISQPTVSRILELMCKMRVITPAFCGNNSASSGKSGLVSDDSGIPLNNLYRVEDDFGYLAGPRAGRKLEEAFRKADEKACAETGWNLHERLLTIRNTLWEGTIERRIRNITTGCLKKTISKIKDRSRAAEIIFKRMVQRHEHIGLTEHQITKIVNARLASCGFAA